MKEFFKKLFCKHNYEKISHCVKYNAQGNEEYTVELYRCKKCGKQAEEMIV